MTEVVGIYEVCKMGFELPMAVVVIALDGSFLDGSVHSLDLTVRPWVLDFGEPVLDAILPAAHIEHVRHVTRGWPIRLTGRKGELDAIVRENRMDFVGCR